MKRLLCLTLAILLLAAMAKAPPYINPLPREIIDALKISTIEFAPNPEAHVHATPEQVEEATRLVIQQIIKRLGARYVPGRGNAVLRLSIVEFTVAPNYPDRQFGSLRVGSTVLYHDAAADYPSVGSSTLFPNPADERERLDPHLPDLLSVFQGVGNSLFNNIFVD
jgi:hypothetical protein